MSLYLKSILMEIKCEMEYKLSFILTALASASSTFFAVLGIVILMDKFGGVGGWTVNEVIFVAGLIIFGHSFTEMFGRGFDHFYKQVKSGSMDRILVRPRSISLQVLCSDFQLTKIGRVLESVLGLIYGIVILDISWNLYKVFVLILMIIGSCTIFVATLLIKAAFSFWTIEGMEFMNIISDGGREVASYPINIYQKWFAKIFTYVIPFGFVNYYPLLFLLNKGDCKWWYGLAPFATLGFLIFSIIVWKIGIRQYQSTGS